MEKLKIVLLILIVTVKLQAQTDNVRFSANLMQWLHNIEVAPEKNLNAVLYNSNGVEYLSAFIKVSNAIDETQLNKLGVVVGTKAGNIWTVRIPKDNMVAFTKLGDIEYIELDHFAKILLDSARYVTGVDSVQEGINIPLPLTGKDVVVGILDTGYDFTHPGFYDTSYTNLRIKRVWDQPTTGTPPTGYSYGSEYNDTLSILQKKYSTTDSTTGDHGTAVATIAAGSGYGSKNNRQYRGIAYESDMVLVEFNAYATEFGTFTYTTMIDGFNYIFTYAQSVGKPCVINVSIGGLDGPHDGSSLFSQAIDNMSGPGKIIVFAAGNEGNVPVHIQKTFSGTDTTLSSIVAVNNNAYFEAWGDTGNTFCLQFGYFNNGFKNIKSQVFCIDNSIRDTVLKGANNDSTVLSILSKVNPLNNRPQFAVKVHHYSADSLYVTVIGKNGTINLWTESEFIGNGTWATAGDSRYTVGEYGCSKSCITVGAYSSRYQFTNLQNQVIETPSLWAKKRGEIALFSSIGPTLDGRMKPDIAAPGLLIASASNSFSPDFILNGQYYFMSVAKYKSPRNNRNYYYSMNAGTSVAAPMVTGTVALMLQVNPTLSPDRIKNIFYKTAIKDSFTTQNPNPALWGAGKINAYAAVKEALLTDGIISVPSDEMKIKVYPNPTHDKFTIEYESAKAGNFLVEITDITGKLIQTKLFQISVGTNQLPLQFDSNSKGIYFVNITGNGGTVTKKILLQ